MNFELEPPAYIHYMPNRFPELPLATLSPGIESTTKYHALLSV